ncbi:MAG: MATE family efflux transporter [Burkholderiaceae bacterium]
MSNPILTTPPLRTMARLVPPSVASTLVQSLILLVEAYWLGALGTHALAAVALVFPAYMLANMLASGAIGGAVSGAFARALGAGRPDRAQEVVNAAWMIAFVVGTAFGAAMLAGGEALFHLLGGRGEILAGALEYSRIVFAGIVVLWLFNQLGACLRGAGEMRAQLAGMLVVTSCHFVAAAVLIPGRGPVPALGLAGAAIAIVLAYACGLLYLLLLIGRRAHPPRLQAWRMPSAAMLRPLARMGAMASSQSVLTILYSMIATGLIARMGTDWLAGYGVGLRLELLMIPVIFGMGGTLIAICGAFVGAGQRERAVRIAWGGAFATAVFVGAIGLLLAWQPQFWFGLFTDDPAVAAACAAYLRIVGPCYAFFGLGLCLYFASQGLDSLAVPVAGTLLRVAIMAIGAILIGSMADPSPRAAFATMAVAMVVYGITIAGGLALGPWRRRQPPAAAPDATPGRQSTPQHPS